MFSSILKIVKMKNENSKKTKRESSAKKGSFLVRFFRRILYLVLSVVFIILILYFFVFPSILNRDMQPKNILIVSSKLDVPSNYIYFAHISNSESKNYYYNIPAQETVDIPNGYGEYPLQSVYGLLKIDKKDDQFIRATFSEILGISIDEVVSLNSQLNDLEEQKLASFFLSSAIQDLFEFKIRNFVKPLYLHYQSKNISINNLNNPGEIADYKDKIATIIGDEYQYCSVAVINSSQVNGLAKKKSQIVESTGALVVRVDDSDEKLNITKIYFGNEPVNCKNLANKISNIFYQKPEILSIDELNNAQQYRAKVIVVVGE